MNITAIVVKKLGNIEKCIFYGEDGVTRVEEILLILDRVLVGTDFPEAGKENQQQTEGNINGVVVLFCFLFNK